jgi:iron complex outermembrane recepter protein
MSVNSIAWLKLVCLGTVAALAISGTSVAQQAPATAQVGQGAQETNQNAQAEEVTVTATRINRPGFVAPTPMTTITAEDLQIAGYTDVGQAIKDLPMDLGDVTPQTDARASLEQGFSEADLRGLGAQRTLTLVNGERPIWSTPSGFDLNTIPISLVQRIDIVTGGASAAWGSDAVSGVVNVVLNDKFIGMKAEAQFGEDWQSYGDKYKADVAFGMNFGPDDRGHFMVGAQWTDSDAIAASHVPELLNGYDPSAANPGHLLLVPNFNYANESLGGLISGPATPTNKLIGTAFGTSGTPYAFQYGTNVAPAAPPGFPAHTGATFMSGGDSEAVNAQWYGADVVPKDDRKTAYGRVSYDVDSDLSLSADFLYVNNYSAVTQLGGVGTNQLTAPGQSGGFEILATNAFLPAAIATQMAAEHLPFITLGRADGDFGALTSTENEQTYWGTLGAKGTIGNTWSWSLFYNYGATSEAQVFGPEPISALLSESVNSKIVGGKAVCASTALANPVTGATCVPVNLFGNGSPSAAALAFFEANADLNYTLTQNEAGGNIQGEPFSTWAGPVSVIAGMEWRTEAVKESTNQLSAAGELEPTNFTPLNGHFSVSEGFLETIVPLLKELPAAQEVDFNGAVRESDYSTAAGENTTWKLGATDDVTDELLLRGTVSQDIRAPNTSELYTVQSSNAGIIVDPSSGNKPESILVYSGGNPGLVPELAHTVTYGGVYKPNWLTAFTFSADWFAIDIHDAIQSEPAQAIVNGCYAGSAALCADIVRYTSGPTAGQVQYVYSYNFNLTKLETSGLDLEANHHLTLDDLWDILPGSLDSHMLLTYVDKMGGAAPGLGVASSVGAIGGSAVGLPALRWRSTLTETYTWDQFQTYARFRYLSGGYNVFAPAGAIQDNAVSAQYYFDLGASYFLTDDKKYQVYGNITNLLGRPPPTDASAALSYYDVFGRTYNVGVRVTF